MAAWSVKMTREMKIRNLTIIIPRWKFVLQDGEVGQVVELVHHLRLGLGERQRVVHGDSWYTRRTVVKRPLYFFNRVPIREHFNNIYTNFSR